MEKRINIFSDSWFWSWTHTLKSKLDVENRSHLPSMKWFLEDFGYEVIEYCQPADSFQQIVEKYFIQEEFKPDADYSFVFFSGLVRRQIDDWVKHCHDYDEFNTWYDNEMNTHLDILEAWAVKYDHPVIIAGGHSRLDSKYVEGRKNIYLLCEDILQDLVGTTFPWAKTTNMMKDSFRRFKLTGDIIDKALDSWHPKLVDEIHTSLKHFEDNSLVKNFTFPDGGHLNIQAHYYLVDWLHDFIQKKVVK